MTIFSKALYTVIIIFTLLVYREPAFAQDLTNKKIIHIDSYHYEYPWSKALTKTISNIIGRTNATLKTHYMDTKRNASEEFKKKAALSAKTAIENFKPDLIIATDDNASKYLITPYFIDSSTPIVFAGLNWNASQYGFPNKHITGMIEVYGVEELLSIASQLSTNNSIGFLSSDTLTEHKDIKYIKELFGIEFHSKKLVTTFKEWKDNFLELQKEVGIIYLGNVHGINDFNKKEAIDFIYKNTEVLTCSTLDLTSDFSAINYIRLPEEQADFAARTAIKILNGASPADIPVSRNIKGKILINSKIINKLKIKIPTELLEVAEIID